MPPRIARVICACFLLAALAVVVSAQLSDKIRAEIAAPLPKFESQPAAPPPVSPVGTPAPLSDDPLVQLPVFHIREKREANNDPDLWLTRRAIQHKALSDYSDSMNDLEWALNCWYIPFVTASPGARAVAAYKEKKIRDEQRRLVSITAIIATTDPAEAAKLLRDLDLSSHPGN
jgi:hypothetical protein